MNSMISKILIVEDEPDIAATLQAYLGRRGFQVSTTASGLEALRLIQVSAPDMMILDFSLKDLNGQEVLQELRRTNQATRVIMITGQMFSPERIEEIRSFGIDGYFHKPIILDDLGRMLMRMTGQISGETAKSCDHSQKSSSGSCSPSASFRHTGCHKLLNLMGIMRNKCENFILSREDGTYACYDEQTLLNMSQEILREAMGTIDESLTIIERLRDDE